MSIPTINHKPLKAIKREKIRLKIKFRPKGGTLSGQRKKMETNKFYERKKKSGY